MEIYTKIFLINLIFMLTMAFFDRNFFNDAIQNKGVIGEAFGFWAFITLVSVPVYLIYLVFTWN